MAQRGRLSGVMLIIGYLGLLLVLHILPLGGSDLSRVTLSVFRVDYLLHSLVFLPWMPLGRRLLGQGVGFFPAAPHIWWFVGGCLLAPALEGVQYLLPYRSFNPIDALYNLLGVIGGGLLVLVLHRSWRTGPVR